MNKLEGKTWEDIVLMAYEECKNQQERVNAIIADLEEVSDNFILEHFEEYVSSYKKKIHIPKWTLLSDATPNDLEIHAEHFYIYCKEDFFYDAKWNGKEFLTYDVYEEGKWSIENAVKYWMPMAA